MNKLKLLLSLMVAAVMMSCTADPTTEGGATKADDAVAKKLINTSLSAAEGRLILFVDDATAELFAAAESATSTGVEAFDSVAAEIGITAIEPVFTMRENDDLARECDLHRWYVVHFSEDADLDDVARKIAKIDAVQSIEFSTLYEAPKTQCIEANPAMFAATRADAQTFNDPMLARQWHYNNTGDQTIFEGAVAGADINLAAAWEITAGRPDIIVAVVDEGVDFRHEDLADNMWVNEGEYGGLEGVDDDDNGYIDDIHGYNFVTNGTISCSRPGDSGHGHHIAGTIAAVNNNGKGVCGIAGGSGKGDGVRIMSVQYSSNGVALGTDGMAKAIKYAADNGASILQCSWGFPTKSTGLSYDNNFTSGQFAVEYEALKYFMRTKNCPALDGGVVIFAAGNDGMSEACYPAAYNEFIAVTAFGPDALPTYYSNFGKGCNVAAPGGVAHPDFETGQVLSIYRNNKYGYMQGTSMACPHVSGVAALALSYAMDLGKTLTLPQLKSILLTSVNDIDCYLTGTKDVYYYDTQYGSWSSKTLNFNNYKGKMGTGMIDAYRVLMGVRGTTCVPVALGDDAAIDVNAYLGDGDVNLKVMEVEVDDTAREKLGIEGDVVIADNMVCIKCTKPGCAILKVKMVAGGKTPGGGMTIGGMLIEKEMALIVRENNDAKGWL